jgi:hypothetical protein
VSFFHEHIEHVNAVVAEHKAPLTIIGSTGGLALTLKLGTKKVELDVPLTELVDVWRNGFRRVAE